MPHILAILTLLALLFASGCQDNRILTTAQNSKGIHINGQPPDRPMRHAALLDPESTITDSSNGTTLPFRHWLASHIDADLALLEAIKPAWGFEPDPAGQASSSETWLGGSPALYRSIPWPHSPNGEALPFVAQLDLTTLPAWVLQQRRHLLNGVLYIWGDTDYSDYVIVQQQKTGSASVLSTPVIPCIKRNMGGDGLGHTKIILRGYKHASFNWYMYGVDGQIKLNEWLNESHQAPHLRIAGYPNLQFHRYPSFGFYQDLRDLQLAMVGSRISHLHCQDFSAQDQAIERYLTGKYKHLYAGKERQQFLAEATRWKSIRNTYQANWMFLGRIESRGSLSFQPGAVASLMIMCKLIQTNGEAALLFACRECN